MTNSIQYQSHIVPDGEEGVWELRPLEQTNYGILRGVLPIERSDYDYNTRNAESKTRWYGLFKCDSESAIEKAKESERQAINSRNDAHEEAAKVRIELKQLEEVIAVQKSTISAALAAEQAAYKGARDARDLNAKYEKDIAKLRKALGELRMNEILKGE